MANLAMLRRLAEQSGRPATFTMGSGNAGPEGWREGLRHVEAANAAGVPDYRTSFPAARSALVQGHNLSINSFSECPSYKAMAGLSFEDKIKELRKPKMRARSAQRKAG